MATRPGEGMPSDTDPERTDPPVPGNAPDMPSDDEEELDVDDEEDLGERTGMPGEGGVIAPGTTPGSR